MKISLNWLRDWVDLPKNLTPKQLAQDLTMRTVEVEKIIDQADQFEKIVVGKVVKLKKHPNADKLRIAMVDIGIALKYPSTPLRAGLNTKTLKHNANNLIQIVCGGTNLRKGMLVAVALPDAKVRWHGKGELIELQETEIRGEKSFGMICSSNEIGMEHLVPCGEMEVADLTQIVVNPFVVGRRFPNLPAKRIYNVGAGRDTSAQQHGMVGQPIAKVLGFCDVIFEIDNKSLTNRPDLWNHYGIAREISAIYKVPLKKLDLAQVDKKKLGGLDVLRIEIQDKNLCSRYIGCLVKNIKIGPSPEWMKKRLEAVGFRAINNIVDITNYVMVDLGEPTHAFDVALLHADKRGLQRELTRIIIRTAKSSEKIKTLDGEERKLNESMLVITDGKKPIALAGIMGGESAEISNKTTEIILEAANFNAMSIRKTSQKLGIRTESSIRFEKALDLNLTKIAMLRMLELIKKVIPQAEVADWVDKGVRGFRAFGHKVIKVEHSFLEKRIGQKFSSREVLGILERLGFKIKNQSRIKCGTKIKNNERNYLYEIEVPSWRATGDIKIPEDIVEEVARIYGYDNLKETVEMVELEKAKYQAKYDLENQVKNYLSLGCKMNEVFNYPWAQERILVRLVPIQGRDPRFASRFLGKGGLIEIENPPAEELKFLEPSLIPNLIKNVKDNLRFFGEFRIFELARVYLSLAERSASLPAPSRVSSQDAGYETSTQQEHKWDEKMQDILPEQPKMLAGAVVASGDKEVFLDVKGIVEGMMKDLRFMIYDLRMGTNLSFLDINKFLQIFVGGDEVGYLGVLNDKIKNKNIGLFEINFDLLSRNDTLHRSMWKYQPLPQYPSIERDLAVEVGWDVKWADLKNEILSPWQARCQDDILEKITFLSEYDLDPSASSGQAKKSLAFRITYQTDRTLKDEEVCMVEKKIIKLLEKKFGARLRKKI